MPTEEFDEDIPTLYNKATIIICSVLLSTFFGGIVYSQNLSEINNKQQITPVMIFCLIWNVIFFNIAGRFTNNFIFTFILPNLLGGIILSTLFWNHHFADADFKSKKIWMPLAVILFVYGLFIGVKLLV